MTASSTAPASGSQISAAAAREIALREVSGTVVDEEYEEERGGWVYGFEIKPTDGGPTLEVEVDAASGKVLEIEEADDDEQEGEHGDGDDHEGDDDDDDDDDNDDQDD